MNKARFDSAFTFKYSPRPPAKSSKLKDDITKEEKDSRLKETSTLQTKISEELNSRLTGKTCEVLVDGSSDKNAAKLSGRTRTNKIAVFGGNRRMTGRTINVKIESVTPYTLKGRIV